jgi:hypothetical protein
MQDKTFIVRLKRPEIMTVSGKAVRVEWFNEIHQAT